MGAGWPPGLENQKKGLLTWVSDKGLGGKSWGAGDEGFLYIGRGHGGKKSLGTGRWRDSEGEGR